MSHGKTVCTVCLKVISSCRCPNHTETWMDICDKCKAEAEPKDPEKILNETRAEIANIHLFRANVTVDRKKYAEDINKLYNHLMTIEKLLKQKEDQLSAIKSIIVKGVQ